MEIRLRLFLHPQISEIIQNVMSESAEHEMVCNYLRLQYPHTLFHTDFAAGAKMTIGQATKNRRLQSSRAWPDLFIAEPRGMYHGLFLEIKKSGTKVFTKDGTLYANPHLAEQNEVLTMLRKKGYFAEFGIGFDGCKRIIDNYLGINGSASKWVKVGRSGEISAPLPYSPLLEPNIASTPVGES